MKFAPGNLHVIICSHLLDASRPILLVAHHTDGWNFACGFRDHAGADDFHVVCVEHVSARDASVDACSDLPIGYLAERATETLPWTRERMSDDET